MVEALVREGAEQFRRHQLDQAKATLEQALRLDARQAKALYMLAGIAIARSDADTGIRLVREALAIEPDNPEYHFSLASVLFTAGRTAEAITHYEEAVARRPGVASWLGQLDHAVKTLHGADAPARQVAEAEPHFERGNTLQRAGLLEEAEEAYLTASRICPDSPAPYVNLALARRDQSRPFEAEAPARRAVALAPTMSEAWFALGTVLAAQARHGEAIQCFRRTIEIKPDHDGAWSFLMFCLNYVDDIAPEAVFEEHLRCARMIDPPDPVPRPPSRSRHGRRLRIGYLSADLVRHPVAQFIEAPLQHHERTRFETFCYFVGAREDAVTQRLKALADNWRFAPELGAEALAQLIRADQIDILVELAGHSKGHRLAVMARRPAPVQVTYLGYPNTTGIRAIDFRLTDAYADPPGSSERWYVERLMYMPDSFLCYTPVETDLPIQPGPRERAGRVTFGSFNNFQKISPTCVALWSRVLQAVPDAQLFVKTRGLDDPGLVSAFKGRFEQHGVAGDRVRVAPATTSHREHLRQYEEVDIALDTFPYHGTTTTLDALWMGVPVLTLAGERHASRVGVSILSNLGLDPMLVASTPDEFVARAATLASQPATLDELRRTLRGRLQASVLLDGRSFTAKLEATYLQMWDSVVDRP
jgi:predicted O-linked N-acetylglucosamine transferase (SPINDLY family)